MFSWSLSTYVIAASVSFALTGITSGVTSGGAIEVEPIQAGSGLFSSFVQIDFNTGDTYVFEVAWTDSTTGFQLLEILQSEAGLQLDADYFDFDGDGEFTDAFVTELGYDGNVHTAPPDFSAGWNYYIRDSAVVDWESSLIGVSDRVVFDGSWDGWTFGGFPGASPQPVSLVPAPAPGMALLLTAGIIRNRRRRC